VAKPSNMGYIPSGNIGFYIELVFERLIYSGKNLVVLFLWAVFMLCLFSLLCRLWPGRLDPRALGVGSYGLRF
jgi:hypothetical protein